MGARQRLEAQVEASYWERVSRQQAQEAIARRREDERQKRTIAALIFVPAMSAAVAALLCASMLVGR
jgi:hypothetical protein